MRVKVLHPGDGSIYEGEGTAFEDEHMHLMDLRDRRLDEAAFERETQTLIAEVDELRRITAGLRRRQKAAVLIIADRVHPDGTRDNEDGELGKAINELENASLELNQIYLASEFA